MSDAAVDLRPYLTTYTLTGETHRTTFSDNEAGVSTYRPRCDVHGIPDCSPLLNGCGRVLAAHREHLRMNAAPKEES